MIYNHLLTCDKNFQLEAHDKKIDLSIADFERVRLLQEPKFLVRFCIFLTCNKCEREAYGMQTGFFFLLLLWSLQAETLLSLLSIWRFDNSKGQSPFLWNEEWKIVSVFKDSLFDMKHSFPLCSSSLTVLNNAFKFSCDHLSNAFLTPYMLKDTLNPIFW